MLYSGFNWDLGPDGVLLDEEISLEKLSKHRWKKGDYFKLVECSDGRVKLSKVDELEAFLLAGSTESIDNNKKRE